MRCYDPSVASAEATMARPAATDSTWALKKRRIAPTVQQGIPN